MGSCTRSRTSGSHYICMSGDTLVYDSGSLDIRFFADWSRGQSSSQSVPVLSLLGCWKRDTLLPWKESTAVVELGLWSMLSTAAVVSNPFLRLGGHNHLSRLHFSHTRFPRAFDMSITLSYELDNPN